MNKKAIEGLLAALMIASVGNGLALWRDSGIVENRVTEVEKKVEKQDNVNKETRTKIDALYWYLIESKGVKIPTKAK